MSLNTLEDYRRHVSDEVDKQTTLGCIFYYTITSTVVLYDEVKAQLEAVQLGDALPRNRPCDADVFRRVFSNGQRRKHIKTVPDPTDLSKTIDVVENLLVRDVARTNERVIKHVVVEDVDAAGERLSYVDAVEVAWNQNTPDDCEVKQLGTYNPRADRLAGELTAAYKRERGCLDENGIRTVIVKALEKCFATSIREGGSVWFIAADYADQVDALERMAANIPGALVHSLPLVDDRKQRNMIRAAFVAEVSTEADKEIVKAINILKSGETISQRKFAVMQTSYTQLKKKATQYQELLQENIDASALRLDLLGRHVANALGKVA